MKFVLFRAIEHTVYRPINYVFDFAGRCVQTIGVNRIDMVAEVD